MSSRLNMVFPKGGSRWFEVIKNFGLVILILGLVTAAAYKGSRRLPGRWAPACRQILSGPWLWVMAGLAVLVASSSSLGYMYYGFLLPGVLILIWGISKLSWRLRQAASIHLQERPSPLSRLYFPAALGVLLLYSDINPRILACHGS
jgi:hypothetical protein